MPRWIAFDEETAEAVMSRFRRGAAEIRQGDPLDAALQLGQPSLIILPSETPGRVLLTRCTPKAAEVPQARSAAPVPVLDVPTGKLPVRPQAEPAPRKWWQRLSA